MLRGNHSIITPMGMDVKKIFAMIQLVNVEYQQKIDEQLVEYLLCIY